MNRCSYIAVKIYNINSYNCLFLFNRNELYKRVETKKSNIYKK